MKLNDFSLDATSYETQSMEVRWKCINRQKLSKERALNFFNEEYMDVPMVLI